MPSCRCKNVGVRQVTRQPQRGGGVGGSRPRTLHPVPPLLLLGVRYLMGNIGFSLCLTLVTIRITPFFKYKLLAISKYDVKFRAILHFIFGSRRARPVVRRCGYLALPYAGHRWWLMMKAPLILRRISEFTVYIHFSKLDVERFSIECCKAKSWVITATNQKKGRYRKQPIRSQSCLKRGKKKVTKIRLILHLYLFGWEDCVRCINQSRCKVKKTNLILVYFGHLMETRSETPKYLTGYS